MTDDIVKRLAQVIRNAREDGEVISEYLINQLGETVANENGFDWKEWRRMCSPRDTIEQRRAAIFRRQ